MVVCDLVGVLGGLLGVGFLFMFFSFVVITNVMGWWFCCCFCGGWGGVVLLLFLVDGVGVVLCVFVVGGVECCWDLGFARWVGFGGFLCLSWVLVG